MTISIMTRCRCSSGDKGRKDPDGAASTERPDRFTLEIPAGKLDAPDEPKIECAARELEEETGFRSENLEFLMTVNTTVAFCDERIGVYIAKDLIPSKQHLDADESIDVEEWEVKDLLDLIYSGKMTDAKTIAAILAYAQKEGIR